MKNQPKKQPIHTVESMKMIYAFNALKGPISLMKIFVNWLIHCVGLIMVKMVYVRAVILDSLSSMAIVKYHKHKILIQIVRNLVMDSV